MTPLEYRILCITFNKYRNNAAILDILGTLRNTDPHKNYHYMALVIRELERDGYLDSKISHKYRNIRGTSEIKIVSVTIDGINAMRNFVEGVDTNINENLVKFVPALARA